jgi:putative transposase
MKLTVQLQLLPDTAQEALLLATVERFNEAANWLAGVAFDNQCANKFELQKLAYLELRERFSLPADMTIRVIAQVVEAYKRDKKKRPKFRKHAAVPYTYGKNYSFKGIDRVSLSIVPIGRAVVPFVLGKYQKEQFGFGRGQADLVRRKDGKWFLLVTVELPDGTPIVVTEFIGVDLGIANIATDSEPDTDPLSGKDVDDVRRKHNLQRKRLQRKGTKGAKKKLVRVSKKEGRFRRHQNHVISRRIVDTAKRTGRGIALENLKHIRDRIKARGGDAFNRLSGWSFAQLTAFIAYKAVLAGVKVVYVDPTYSSQTCSVCGHCDRSNRKSQSEFLCKRCGYTAHADKNAARNHKFRAQVAGNASSELDKLPA